jgi:hypothetical protein
MDLRGEEARKLLGEESFKLLGKWLDSVDEEAVRSVANDLNVYAVKDEDGNVIAEFEGTTETAARVSSLLIRAVETQKEKLAAWMIENGFSTGHGDSQEDLLKELSLQVKELRDRYVS